MSTIASPRAATAPRPPALAETPPPSSGRPSFDASSTTTTTAAAGASSPQATAPKRSNRAALREYYKIRATPAPPRVELEVAGSEVPASDLDAPDFNAAEYVARTMNTLGLEDLLRMYTQVVGEVRALDAEKKALVYDNYSKLITATETIRKLRAEMDPLNPMASTLDPAIAQIYQQANSIREKLRESVPAPDSEEGRQRERARRQRRTRELAAEVVATPARLRLLASQGKTSEAKQQWEMPRRLLVAWQDKGIGGPDVQEVIDEGDAVFEPEATATPG